MGWFVKIFFVAAGIGGAGLALLYALQEKLIYVPRIPGMAPFTDTPDKYSLNFEDAQFEARDGTELHGWFMYPQSWSRDKASLRPTIMFFQENAGSMSMRLPFLRDLIRLSGCSVFAPSYRGYGMSKGSPSEAGLKQDAQAALDWLLHRQRAGTKIVLMGKSLGGAVSIYLAAARPGVLQAVVVENTFTCLEDVAPKVLPFLKYLVGKGRPANWLLRNKWNSLGEISQVKDTPLLLFSSLQDEMLPPIMMRQLFQAAEAAKHSSVTWVEFEDAHHMDAYFVAQHEYWPALLQFLRQHGCSKAPGEVNTDSEPEYEDLKGETFDEDIEELQAHPGAEAVAAGEQGAQGVQRRQGVRVEHAEP